jgi:muramidase (phage lysozyme)
MQPDISKKANSVQKIIYSIGLLLTLFTISGYLNRAKFQNGNDRSYPSTAIDNYTPNLNGTAPLAMKGGDPYLRALMRTISASEANVTRPYNAIYGNKIVEDLKTHPEICVAIVAGPNIGNCTTAAGRYQMLNFTWEEKARQYHPHPAGFWQWKTYSFEPEYQDEVVYHWLSDRSAWDEDIPQLLQQGKINKVLSLLSNTWTSLGYGIETNSMSGYLPKIYQNMLREELADSS